MKTILTLIERTGGLEALKEKPIRVGSGGYMPLTIESVGVGPRGFPLVSVTHYFEQNGDLMSDPDMTFEVAGGKMFPVSFRQDSLGVHKVAVFQEDGKTFSRPGLQKDLGVFARQWDRNLKAQGFLGGIMS